MSLVVAHFSHSKAYVIRHVCMYLYLFTIFIKHEGPHIQVCRINKRILKLLAFPHLAFREELIARPLNAQDVRCDLPGHRWAPAQCLGYGLHGKFLAVALAYLLGNLDNGRLGVE